MNGPKLTTQTCLLLVLLVVLAGLVLIQQQPLAQGLFMAQSTSEYEIGPDYQWLRKQEARMEQRRKRVKEVCQSQGDALKWERTINRRYFLADETHNLAYCRIPKVGTTTLLRYFLELSDLDEDTKNKWKYTHELSSFHDKVEAMFLMKPIKSVKKISQYLEDKHLYPFVFVRHPFERIVSAYEDKMVVNKPRNYLNLAKMIGTSFSDFVDYIINKFKEKSKKCDPRKGGCAIDQHFTPFFSWCAFCDINYQAIGKAETFKDDLEYILRINGLDKLITKTDVRMHAVPHEKDRAKKYFAELNLNQRELLYKIYKLDFELFDYDNTGYM